MLIENPLLTKRLLLRSLSREDIGFRYVSWMNDININKYLESRFRAPFTVEDITDFVIGANESNHSFHFGIFLRHDGRHIGNIKLGPILFDHSRSEVGYMIGDSDSWGKGYASEAIRCVCDYGINTLGLAKISAGVYRENRGSAKALIKAGFTHEATIPSHVIYEGERIDSLIFGLNS